MLVCAYKVADQFYTLFLFYWFLKTSKTFKACTEISLWQSLNFLWFIEPQFETSFFINYSRSSRNFPRFKILANTVSLTLTHFHLLDMFYFLFRLELTHVFFFLSNLCRWVKDAVQKHWNYGVVGWSKVTRMWEWTTWQHRGAMDWRSALWSANVHRSSKCPTWCK